MKRRWGWLLFAVLVGLDRWTKWWAVQTLSGQDDIRLWPGVLHFRYAENYGAAFSILQNQRILLLTITSLALAAVIVLLMSRLVQSRAMAIGLWMIAAGGIGNLLDRAFRGFVVDFIYFVPINFPVFNVADSAVSVGTVIFAVTFFVLEWRNRKTQRGTLTDGETEV